VGSGAGVRVSTCGEIGRQSPRALDLITHAGEDLERVGLVRPCDRVAEGTINGLPAILVRRPADSEFGLGTDEVIVIEDRAGSEYVVLPPFVTCSSS